MSTTSYIKARPGGGLAFNIKIPRDVAQHFLSKNGRTQTHITIGLGTRSRTVAEPKARALALQWKAEFARLRDQPQRDPKSRDQIYAASLSNYVTGSPIHTKDPTERLRDLTREALDLQREFDRRGLESYDPIPPDLKARMDAMEDARRILKGHKPNHTDRYEPAVSMLGERWLKERESLARKQGRTSSLTAHYAPPIHLFSGYVGPKTIRQVTREDVALYVEILQGFDRNWGRGSPSAKLDFWELKALFSLSETPLSERAVRHHLRTLSALWKWADSLGLCDSHNPFQGFVKSIQTKGRPTLAFSPRDLMALFHPSPEHGDLHESMLVALYSGLKANELAALNWTDIMLVDDIPVMLAGLRPEGQRQVPLHSALGWLLDKKHQKVSSDRVWPLFKGKGVTLSRYFAQHKKERGILSPQKGFLSFRKTVGACLEANQVTVEDWRTIMGYKPVSGQGGYKPNPPRLKDTKRLIELITYPDLNLPLYRF